MPPSILFIPAALLLCGICALVYLWVLLNRGTAQIEAARSSWDAAKALQFLSNLLDDIVSGADHQQKLREFAANLPYIVKATAGQAGRTELNITYDIIASTQVPLVRNLNDSNELGIEQISGQCGVQWILCPQPSDIASVRDGGWYERLRQFLRGGGVVFYFAKDRTYADFIVNKIGADTEVGRPIETDETRATCQIWHVPCDEPALLMPEAVIWNPLAHEWGRARGYVNGGDSLQYEEEQPGRFVLQAEEKRLTIADMDKPLLEARVSSASKYFNQFLSGKEHAGEILQRLALVMVNEDVDEKQLRSMLNLNSNDADRFVERIGVEREATLTVYQGGKR